MGDTGTTALGWLLHTVVGGGLLLLATWLVMRRVSGPARRQLLGEWAIGAAIVLSALSLAPAWLALPLPAPEAAGAGEPPSPVAAIPEPSPPVLAAEVALALPEGLPPEGGERRGVSPPVEPNWRADAAPLAGDVPPSPDPPLAEPAPAAAAGHEAAPSSSAPPPVPWTAERIGLLALAVYGSVAVVLLGRWLLGHVVLWRLLRRGQPAQGRAACLFAQMSAGRRARLLVSRQVRVPFSCGLVRPAVVLPAALAEEASEPVLRWVFAHELTHLERRDARAALLFALGQVLYFYLPWFWWLRRQVRLCQEFLADAAAARTGQVVDYAQFLVGWTTAPAPPVGAAGVSGPCSDLFRRIAMLLKHPAPLESRCPRRWSVLAGAALLSLAVVGAGVGLGVHAAPAPSREEPKKEDPKKAEPKAEPRKAEPAKEEPKKEATKRERPPAVPGIPAFPDIEEILKRLPPGLDPQEVEAMRKRMEQARKEMEKHMQQLQGFQPGAGFPGLQGLGGLGGVFPGGQGHEPRLGTGVAKPSATLADQLDLPHDQGVVVERVVPNSPADKAGIKPHDILLELNGKPVPADPAGVAKLVAGIKADTPVEAVVLRKGKRETLKGLTLPEAKAAAPALGSGAFPGLPGGNFPPVPPPPAVPGAGFNPFGGGNPLGGGDHGVMTTTFRSGDRFTTRHQEGSLVITVTGKVSDGKSTVSEIRVQDGRESHKYTSVDKVPEEYRDKVKNLLEMTDKTNVRIEIQSK